MPYETMMYAGIASTAIFLTISGVIFFQLDIRSVIGYLTGTTARKAIREMESGAASGKTGSFVFGNSKGRNVKPGKTADISVEEREKEKKRSRIFGRRRKDAVYMQKEAQNSAQTMLLEQANTFTDETELLKSDPEMATTVLRADGQQDRTTLLQDSEYNGIENLKPGDQRQSKSTAHPGFHITEHVIIVHTEETI